MPARGTFGRRTRRRHVSSQGRIQQAKPDPDGLVQEAESTRELRYAARIGLDVFGEQSQVQQLSQDATVGLDELAIHPGHIDLAQIHGRPRMGLQPCDDVQQTIPAIGQFQRLDGSPGQPRQQRRLCGGRLPPQRLEMLRLPNLADEGQRFLQGIDRDGGGAPLHALDTVIPFAPFDSNPRGIGEGRRVRKGGRARC